MTTVNEYWSSREEDCMLNENLNNAVKNTNTNNEKRDTSDKTSTKGIFAQCMLTGAVMIITAACGMPIGYSAILLPQLEATNGTLHIDENIGSWIASIHSAATPLGSFISGFLMDMWGRKIALQISMLPLIIGWIMIAAAGNHAVLLAGRLIAGMSVGLTAAPAQVIIGEISQPFVRGIFSSAPFATYAFGILLVYALGSVSHWRLVAGFSIILPVLAVFLFFILPESPVWLVRQGCVEEATQSLTWLRGGDIEQAKRETEQLVARIQIEKSQKTQSNRWKQLFKPHVLKPFIVINLFNLMQVFSGTYIVVFYAVDILAQMGDNIVDNFLAAVLTSGVRFIFTIVASVLLAVIGRRTLALGSGFGTAITALALGTCLYTGNIDFYMPAILVLLYVAANTIGFMILPGVMLGELYPAKIRGFAGGLTFMMFNIAVFGTTKMFPAIKHALGLHGVFWLFGGCSLIACVFLYLTLPETQGRTLSQIEDYFLEKNVLWITRDKEWEKKNLKGNQTI